MISVLVGKHRSERKGVGSVTGWERIPSFPEAPSLPVIERSLPLRDLLETQHEQVAMGDRFETQEARLTRMFVTGSFADQIRDRKSTRLNSSHRTISYAVFCLKKKNKKKISYNHLKRHNT